MQILRQFFSLIRPYWFNPKQWFAWLLLIAVIGSGLAIVQISVFVNLWNKDFYDALTAFETEKIPALLLRYLAYMAIIVFFVAAGSWLRKLLILRWRTHLTHQLMTQWLSHHRHYHLSQQYSDLDNPDQRIAEDVALLAEKSLDLIRYLFSNIAKLVAFLGVLWMMSGVQQINIMGTTWHIHGYLVWLALIYTLICSLITHLIGRQLKPLNVNKQKVEANYRRSLIRVRENSEQIAFYQGEKWEENHLRKGFRAIQQNWRDLMNREFKLEVFTASYLRITNLLPIFAVLPLYLSKAMTFGDMMQARSAFSSVQDGFGWFMDFYKRIMEWAATVQRLWEFQHNLQSIHEEQPNQTESHQLFCQNVAFLPPQKQAENQPHFPHIQPVSFQLQSGEWLQLAGESGIGKSSFLRILAGLWQNYQGHFSLPQGRTLFLAQKSYFPQGTLAEILKYSKETETTQEELEQALRLVGLPHLIPLLQEERPWEKQLSGGEQQRLAFAQALLLKPALLCLDESTNQLDLPSAIGLLVLLKQKLPNCVVVGITHQSELELYFDKQYRLENKKG